MPISAGDLLDSLSEPAAVLTADGACLATNAAWRATGIDAPGAAGGALGEALAAQMGERGLGTWHYTVGAGAARRDFRFDVSPLPHGAGILVRRRETTRARRAAGDHARLAARYAAVLDATGDATITMNADGIVMDVNRAVGALFGYEREEVVGRPLTMLMPDPDGARHPDFVARFLATGEARIIGRERLVAARRKDGGVLKVRLTVREARVEDERLFVGVLHDVSEAERAREERDSNALGFALALDAGRLGFLDVDLATGQVRADPRCRGWFGYDAATPLCFEDLTGRLAPEDVARTKQLVLGAPEGGDVEFEARLATPDDADRQHWIAMRGRVVARDGAPRFVAVVADITERREAADRRLREERDAWVIGEMRHRIKNLFTMVGAILNLSLRGRPEATEYKLAVEERLGALAAAQTRLAESGFRSARVDEIIARELEPFIERKHAIDVSPCDVVIAGQAAQILSMIVHELTTNATKHGALGRPTGRLRVACAEEGDRIVLTWREDGGPPVAPPTRRGFGTTVIRRMAERFLEAEVEADYHPDGFRYRLSMPRTCALDGALT